MKTEWFKGLNEDEKESFKINYAASEKLRKRLSTIINVKTDESLKKIRGESSFDKADYTHYVATHLGYQRALHEIKLLLEN